MIVTVPIKVWLKKRGEESGLTPEELMRELRRRDKYRDKPIRSRGNRIRQVMVSCNKAAAIAWTAEKIAAKMEPCRCACGKAGIKYEFSTFVCAECQALERKYSRAYIKHTEPVAEDESPVKLEETEPWTFWMGMGLFNRG